MADYLVHAIESQGNRMNDLFFTVSADNAQDACNLARLHCAWCYDGRLNKDLQKLVDNNQHLTQDDFYHKDINLTITFVKVNPITSETFHYLEFLGVL